MSERGAFFTYDPSVGVVIPDTLTVRERIVEMFQNAFGATFATDNSTPAGILVDSLTKMFAEQCGIVAQSANGFNINVAQGRWLDAIGTLLGLTRHSSTKTYVMVGLYAIDSSGGRYDSGAIEIKDGGGNVYFNDSPVSFESANTVKSVKLRSYESGSIDYVIGGFSVIDNANLKVSSTASFSPRLISAGTSSETDFEYRNRLLSATARSRGYAESVKNAIMEADMAVKSVAVGVNSRTAYIYQDGIVYPPNSIAIVVEGYSNTESIEDAIRATVPFGVSYAKTVGGDQHKFWIDASKKDVPGYQAYWHSAKTTPVYIKGKCTMLNYIGDATTAKSEIVALIKKYCGSIGVGSKISSAKISSYLRSYMSGVEISDVDVSLTRQNGTTTWSNGAVIQSSIFNIMEVIEGNIDFTFTREEA